MSQQQPGSGWPAESVVYAAQKGDPAAIAALLSSAHPHVHRLARGLCATPQDAEDAAQDSLLILYRKIGTLRATAALGSWMFRIIRNECLRYLRRPAGSLDALVTASPSAEQQLLIRLETERIVDAIWALPDDQRAVLVLRDVQGHSGAITAQLLGLSKAAMKSRLHRARNSLRLALEDPPQSGSVGARDGRDAD